MIKHCAPEIKKTLIFGAQYKSDIFYEEDIKKISNLNYKIFLSREEVS
jgi:NAD(P)H-flavin reductase